MLVKLFALGNAAGDYAPPFFIIAHNGMPEDEFFLRQVKRLNYTGDIAASNGFIAICKTKGGCPGLWKAFFSQFCIPTIHKVAEENRNERNANMRPFLNIDGELCILKQMFDDSVIEEIDKANLTCSKLPPGTTTDTQAWDVGTTFKDAKRALRGAFTETSTENAHNQALEQNLNDYLEAFKTEYKDKIRNPITTEFKTKFVYSIKQIVHAIMKQWNRDKVAKGFLLTGQYCPPNEKNGYVTADFDKMMDACTNKNISDPEYSNMCANIDNVGLQALNEGFVSDEYLDSLKITREGHQDRDEASFDKMPSFIISHRAARERFFKMEEERQKREAEAAYRKTQEYLDAKEREKEEEKKRRDEERQRIKDDKADAAFRKKAEKVAKTKADKAYRDTLDTHSKQLYDAAKKYAAEKKKEENRKAAEQRVVERNMRQEARRKEEDE